MLKRIGRVTYKKYFSFENFEKITQNLKNVTFMT